MKNRDRKEPRANSTRFRVRRLRFSCQPENFTSNFGKLLNSSGLACKMGLISRVI